MDLIIGCRGKRGPRAMDASFALNGARTELGQRWCR